MEPCTGQHPSPCVDCAIVRARTQRKIKGGLLAAIVVTGNCWRFLGDFIVMDHHRREQQRRFLRGRWRALPAALQEWGRDIAASYADDLEALGEFIGELEQRRACSMITAVCQRADHGRVRFRPAGETICTSAYDVARIPDDTTAKAFILAHHYERTYPAARFRFGLYRAGELVGVAVFGQPWKHVAAAAGLAFPVTDVLELSRFVLLDQVPANGESWFAARTFEMLRTEAAAVMSFSDPEPRTTAGGAVVFRGHVGTIYQATNGVYVGRGRRRTVRLLPDGSLISDRALTKIRKGDRGWRYSVEQLVRAGAERPGADLRGWLNEWLRRLARNVRHPGNHRYVWALQRRLRHHLPAGQRYPKIEVPA